MSVSPLKVLRDAVKSQRFDGAYYVAGEDGFQAEDAVKQLVNSASDPATRDFNLDMRRGSELDVAELDALLSALPIMAPRRVIVIREVNLLRKDVRKVLDDYLAHPAPETVLILVAAPGTKVDPVLSKTATPLAFNPLTEDRIPRWIAHYAVTEHSARITEKGAELLHIAVGADLYQLAAEVDKLASYSNGGEIDEAAVAAVVGVRHGESLGPLLDAVGEGNAQRAIPLVPIVLGQPKQSAVTVVMALSTQFLALGWARAKLDEGSSRSRLATELFGLLKRNPSQYTGRSWSGSVTAWMGMLDRWSSRGIDRVLGVLLEVDVALKETRLSGDEQLITGVVLRICSEATAQRAAA
jgi:DNA polymerase III subunit delta